MKISEGKYQNLSIHWAPFRRAWPFSGFWSRRQTAFFHGKHFYVSNPICNIHSEKKVARVSPGLYLLKRPRRVVNFSYSFFCCWFCCFALPRALLTFTINSSEHAVSCNFPRPRLFDFLTLSLALHHPCEALAHTWVGAVVVFLLGWLLPAERRLSLLPPSCITKEWSCTTFKEIHEKRCRSIEKVYFLPLHCLHFFASKPREGGCRCQPSLA